MGKMLEILETIGVLLGSRKAIAFLNSTYCNHMGKWGKGRMANE